MSNALGDLMIAQIKAQAPQPTAPTAPSSDSSTWGVAQKTQPATQPAQSANVLNTSDLDKPVAASSTNQGTFVSYDPNTGLGSNRRALDIGTQGQNDFLEIPIPGADYAQNPNNWVVTHKTANTLYGFKKPAVQSGALEGEVMPAPKSAMEQKTAMIDNFLDSKTQVRQDAKEREGVDAITQQMNKANEIANDYLAKVEQMQADLNLKDILNSEAQIALKDAIEGRGVGMTHINRMLSREMGQLDQNQRISRLHDIYQLNTMINAHSAATRNAQLMQGQYQMAMDNVRESVGDWMEYQQLKLNLLTEMGQLEKEERNRLDKEIEYERGLMEQGYVHVENLEAREKIMKDMGITASTYNQFFYKDPGTGKIYLRPDATGDADFARSMMMQYPDSGIKPTDSIETVQSKIAKSRIYQKQTSIGGGGGGGGAGGFNWDSLFGGASTEVMGFDEFADDWMKKNQMSIDPALLQEEYNNYVAQNQSVTDNQVMGLSPSQVALMQGAGLTDIQIANAAGIFNGSRPPLTGIGANSKEGQAVTAGLVALGYDIAKATQDWDAMKKRLNSMNSTQQLRLSQAIYALEGSTHQAERLYSEWVKTGLPKGYSSYNKAALVAAANLPGQAGVAARTLISHVEDMANELSVVYRGGNTPTDQSLQSARLSLSADWNPEQFKRNLALIRENMRIRQNSIASSGYIEGNVYNRTEPVANNQFFGNIGLDMGGMDNQAFFNLIK